MSEERDINLGTFIASKAKRLHAQHETGVSAATSWLAKLRRGAGDSPQKHPELWMYTIGEIDGVQFPGCKGDGDEPSYDEQAAYNALTFFALHQQSKSERMHESSWDADKKIPIYRHRFGAAIGRLVHQTSPSVKNRFDALLKARTEAARIIYLRALIQLLRTHNIAFDYGHFARDYAELQNPQTRNNVILRWGRDFIYGYEYSGRQNEKSSDN